MQTYKTYLGNPIILNSDLHADNLGNGTVALSDLARYYARFLGDGIEEQVQVGDLSTELTVVVIADQCLADRIHQYTQHSITQRLTIRHGNWRRIGLQQRLLWYFTPYISNHRSSSQVEQPCTYRFAESIPRISLKKKYLTTLKTSFVLKS